MGNPFYQRIVFLFQQLNFIALSRNEFSSMILNEFFNHYLACTVRTRI